MSGALTSGCNLAMAVAAGLTLLASVIAATVIRVRQPAPAATSLTASAGRRRARPTRQQGHTVRRAGPCE